MCQPHTLEFPLSLEHAKLAPQGSLYLLFPAPPEVHLAGALISLRSLANVTVPEIFSDALSRKGTPYHSSSLFDMFGFPL